MVTRLCLRGCCDGDCNDADPNTNQGAAELCATPTDDDCDGTINEGVDATAPSDATIWYADSDSDTQGDANTTLTQCTAPPNYVANSSDCDDENPNIYLGAIEYCNSSDDDCDGLTDEDDAVDKATWYADSDGDNYGDGGAIFTNDEELAGKMKSIRVHGSGADKYKNIRLGINGRLDTFQAAILLEKLSIFSDELKSRNKVADYYSSNITSDLIKPFTPKDYFSSWAQYSLLSKSNSERDKIMLSLSEADIPSMIYYKLPLHLQIVLKKLGYKKGDFPVAEKLCSEVLSFPHHQHLKPNEIKYISNCINKFYE